MFVISQPSEQALSWQCGELHCLGRLAYECLSSWSTSKAPGRERYKVLLLQSWENLASQKSHQEPIKDSLMPDNDSSPMWITSVICSKLQVQGQLRGNKSKLQSSGTSDIFSPPPRCSQDAVGGQVLSELFTNRKENIPLQFSEDCLYLNIYTPADLTKNSRLPVSVGTTGPESWAPASSSSSFLFHNVTSGFTSDIRFQWRSWYIWNVNLKFLTFLT